MRRASLLVILGVVAVCATGCPVPPGPSTPVVYAEGVERVSLAADGSQTTANWSSMRRPAISADGRFVAFDHLADGLVAEDDNGVVDVFVHDRATGVTERVSVASDGTQGTRGSSAPSISADGRYVAFESDAAELHPGDGFLTSDVFLRDRLAGTTTRMSLAPGGAEPDGQSQRPTVSSDGTKVAFWSSAENLTPNGSGVQYGDGLYVYDVASGTLSRPEMTHDGQPAYEHHDEVAPAVSADGRYLAFDSASINLSPADTNYVDDVFVHDTVTGTTTLVSVASDGTQGDRDSINPRLSGDGRYVVFGSFADNLAPGPTVGAHPFVHDMVTGETIRASVADDGTPADRPSQFFDISADGRYVSFSTDSTNLAAGDLPGNNRVYVRDTVAGTTVRVPPAPSPFRPLDSADSHAISDDGGTVVFWSAASNYVLLDTNGRYDLFVHDLGG